MTDRTYRVLFPFCGLGAGALGFLRASVRMFGDDVRFESAGGIDIDAAACRDFERFTGSPALCADVATLTPMDLRVFVGNESPDVVFSSPPCVGASPLLGEAKSREARYQALNELALVWTRTMLDAWPIDPPRLLIYENVPGIKRRGAIMLRELRKTLRAAGYLLHEGSHDCGEIGGLAQHRKRWLLVARRPATVPTFLYQPPKRRVRGVGEVIGELPMPGDPSAGPLHRLPRVSWLTWVRLALIPAGGDWRHLPASVALPPSGVRHAVQYAVVPWDAAAHCVTSATDVQTGAPNVADPRLKGDNHFANSYRVTGWDDPDGCVTSGTAPGSGGGVVADCASCRFQHLAGTVRAARA